MRNFLKDKDANMNMIFGVIGLFITIIISILVLYSIAGGVDFDSMDSRYYSNLEPAGGAKGGAGNTDWNQTPGANASGAILNQAETFYSIAPIIGIVVVAVIILGYVSRIGG